MINSDPALEILIQDRKSDRSRIWTSIDRHHAYTEKKGTSLSRRKLMERLQEHFEDNLLVLSSQGVANIIMFRSRAGEIMKIVDDVEDNDTL